jgi:hypothetical protein
MSINSGNGDRPAILRPSRTAEDARDDEEEEESKLLDPDAQHVHQSQIPDFHRQRSRKVVNPSSKQQYSRVPTDSPPLNIRGSSRNLRTSNNIVQTGVTSAPAVKFPVSRALAFALFATLSAGEVVLRRLLAYSVWNYRWIVVQLQCVVTAIVFTLLAMFNCYRGKYKLPNTEEENEWDDPEDSERRRHKRRQPGGRKTYISISKHTVIALLELSQQLMLFIPAGVVSGYGTAILPQSMIILILMGICVTGKGKVRKQHALGGVLAILGIVLIWNQILDGCGDRSELFWNAMIMVSAGFPAGMSIIYKSIVFTEVQVDLILFNMVSGLLQSFLGFVLSPIGIASQYLGQEDASYEAFDIFANLRNGIHCIFLGEDFVSTDSCAETYPRNVVLFVVYFLLVFGVQASLRLCLKLQEDMVAGKGTSFEIESTHDMVGLAQVISCLVAFIVFWIPPIRDVTSDTCFNLTVLVVLGLVFWMIGQALTTKLTEPPTIVKLSISIPSLTWLCELVY